jgi:SAM-dependent methyltransferase
MLHRYEEQAKREVPDPTPLWADGFSRSIFRQRRTGRVVDIGCGDGRFTTILADLGIRRDEYLGIDLSAEQIAFAQKLHPGHHFEVGSIYEVGSRYPRHFSGFWCAAILMLLPRERLQEALSSLRACLTVGAVGLVSTPAGSGEALSVNGFELTLYEADELQAAFTAAQFDADVGGVGHMLLASVTAI